MGLLVIAMQSASKINWKQGDRNSSVVCGFKIVHSMI